MVADDEAKSTPEVPVVTITGQGRREDFGLGPAGSFELVTDVQHTPTPTGIQITPASSAPAPAPGPAPEAAPASEE